MSSYNSKKEQHNEIDLSTRLLKSGFYLESLGGFRESNRRIES
jgi:hypothetical protein